MRVDSFDLNLILPIINSNLGIDDKIKDIRRVLEDNFFYLKSDFYFDNSLIINIGYVSDPTSFDIFENLYCYQTGHLYNELLYQFFIQEDINNIDSLMLGVLYKYKNHDSIKEIYYRSFKEISKYLSYKRSDYIFKNFSEDFLYKSIKKHDPIYFDTDHFYLKYKIDPIIKGKYDKYVFEFPLKEIQIPYINFLGKKKLIKYIDGEFTTKGLARQTKIKEEQLSVYNNFKDYVLSRERDRKLDILGI